jgi:DNA-directed RNA polymerase subunit RPC12/RpoP
MKFVCLDCDEPMKLHQTEGPDEGSLTVTFRCPECGFRVAMLTNPYETQMVRSLGVKVGARAASEAAAAEPQPFAHLRASLAEARTDAFAGATPSGEPAAAATESGCPFAAALGGLSGTASPSSDAPPTGDAGAAGSTAAAWTPEAEARVERIPAFIRPMARRAIERFASERGYATITEPVMDEARGLFGM